MSKKYSELDYAIDILKDELNELRQMQAVSKYAIEDKIYIERTNSLHAAIEKLEQCNEVVQYVSGSTFEQVIKLLDSMNADERMDVFADYCTYCGDKDPSCQCWNDE